MEDRLVNQIKRIYHDTKQAINECNFLTKQELEQLTLSQDEDRAILSVHGSESSLIKAACLLRELHARFLRTFVLSAFDLTWDMITTPKRFEYAKQKELELYQSLMSISNLKQDEIRSMIRDTIQSLKLELSSNMFTLDSSNSLPSSSILTQSSLTNYPLNTNKQHKNLNTNTNAPTSNSNSNNNNNKNNNKNNSNNNNNNNSSNNNNHRDEDRCLTRHLSSVGSLSRLSLQTTNKEPTSGSSLSGGNLECRSSSYLSRSIDSGGGSSSLLTNELSTQSLENISSRSELQLHRQEIQELVLQQLNAAIASKLVGSVESLRNSYVGTLERCLASLEQSCLENNEPPHALLALRQILNAAYRVEVSVESSSSLLRVLWERMKFLLANSVPMSWSNLLNSKQHNHHTGQTTGTTTTTATTAIQTSDSWIGANQFGCCIIDGEWKKQQALSILDSLSESRLAKTICSQFRARLKSSHEQFLQSIRDLEAQHAGRLQHTEELRLRVRKMHAPRMAKFALESTSLIDLILYGMPCLEKEIGRGQYGVVYACESWAGHSPCAVKSVVPPDDKHWYDLAMEFYYTRCIPEHERIVNIYGSVIDHSYGSGSTPAVLLIMQRLDKDLYSAIRSGIDWLSRLQVAIDVVEGIRFLHNQGLVHRDIKLKNILLDSDNRAKVTDLGFCKPEAMMSGSVVGTPIHMSPELFSGRYDNSVDVYAFGILFWYICAGHVRLPHIFEQCQTRDQLWNCVRRGVRPERLPQFDDECWQLMVQCWDGDRHKRPHLGDVEIKLRQIHARYA